MAADRSDASQRDRHLPFGLQLLLAAGVILLIGIVARQFTVAPAKHEVAAVNAIEKGGNVWLREPPDEIQTPFGSYRRSWLALILGEHYFKSILRVRIWRSPRDAVLAPPFDKRPEVGVIMRHFGRLRSCEEVILCGTRVGDADLKYLAGVPMLRLVDLTATGVTDAGVQQLAAARDLEELVLDHTAVSDRAVESLARFSKLKRLSLKGALVTEGGVAALRRVRPDLEVACIPAPSEEARSLAASLVAENQPPGVIAIQAVRTRSGKSAYGAGASWRQLSSNARDKRRPDLSGVLDSLRRLPLVHLELYGLDLDAEECDALLTLAEVDDLYIVGGSLVRDMRQIARLKRLRKLKLLRCSVCDELMEQIATLPDLEELHVRWPQPYLRYKRNASGDELAGLGDGGLAPLGRVSGLRRLTLRGTPETRNWTLAHPIGITDAGLVHLAALPHLEYLDLSGTKVTAAGLRLLRNAPRLRELVLLGIALDAEQERELRGVLHGVAIQTGELDTKDSKPPAGSGGCPELLQDPDLIF